MLRSRWPLVTYAAPIHAIDSGRFRSYFKNKRHPALTNWHYCMKIVSLHNLNALFKSHVPLTCIDHNQEKLGKRISINFIQTDNPFTIATENCLVLRFWLNVLIRTIQTLKICGKIAFEARSRKGVLLYKGHNKSLKINQWLITWYDTWRKRTAGATWIYASKE